MTAREYLEQIKPLEEHIKSKEQHVEKLREEAEGTSVNFEGERVQSSSNPQQMEKKIVKYVDIEEGKLKALKERRQEISDTMDELPTLECDVLYKFYVLDYTLQMIADAYAKSKSWARDKRKHALKLLQKILDERKENE